MRKKEFPLPCPFQPTVACFTGMVIVADSTYSLVDHRIGLRSIGQPNVRIHGRNVQVIDQGIIGTFGIVTHDFESGLYGSLDLVIVGNFVH